MQKNEDREVSQNVGDTRTRGISLEDVKTLYLESIRRRRYTDGCDDNYDDDDDADCYCE